jgi:hypothetical protein
MFIFRRKKAAPKTEIVIFAIVAILFLSALLIWNNANFVSNSLLNINNGNSGTTEITALPSVVSVGNPINIKVTTRESMYCGAECNRSIVIYENENIVKKCTAAAVCEHAAIHDYATSSSYHAEIQTDDGDFHFVDFTSRSIVGTWINDQLVITPIHATLMVGESLLLSAYGCSECDNSLQIKEGNDVLVTCNNPLNCSVLVSSINTDTRNFHATQGEYSSNLAEIIWSEAWLVNISTSKKYPKLNEPIVLTASANQLGSCGASCYRELAIYRGTSRLASCRELTCSAVDNSSTEAKREYHAQIDVYDSGFYHGSILGSDKINVYWTDKPTSTIQGFRTITEEAY